MVDAARHRAHGAPGVGVGGEQARDLGQRRREAGMPPPAERERRGGRLGRVRFQQQVHQRDVGGCAAAQARRERVGRALTAAASRSRRRLLTRSTAPHSYL